MPKKSKGKVPLNKKQTKQVRKYDKAMDAYGGTGAQGFWHFILGHNKNKKG